MIGTMLKDYLENIMSKVEVPITDNLSILVCRIWEFIEKLNSMCAKIRMKKNEKKGFSFLMNEYFIQYKCGFFIGTHFGLIDSPITASFGTFP